MMTSNFGSQIRGPVSADLAPPANLDRGVAQCTVIVSPVVSIFEWYLRGSQEEIVVILCHIDLNAAHARTIIPRGA